MSAFFIYKPENKNRMKIKLKLHEVEIYSDDSDGTAEFYKQIGFPFNFENGHLKVFSFPEGQDFDVSKHHKGQLRISYMTDDLDGYISNLLKSNIEFEGPYDTHLGLKEITLIDPENNRIAVHQATEQSPPFIKDFL